MYDKSVVGYDGVVNGHTFCCSYGRGGQRLRTSPLSVFVCVCVELLSATHVAVLMIEEDNR